MLQRAEASDSTERIATPLAGHDALENALVALDRAVGEVVADRDDDAERRHELARALDAIPQGVVVVDRVGHEVFRNRFALDFETARHGEALVAAAIEESLAAALAGASEQRPVDLFGPPRRNFVVTAMPLHANDRLVGAVALVEDVTERRRLDAVRRDFVANISHELKTPIGALALLAETLVEEEDSAVARRLAERMLSEALRVNRTIEDLLELTRIENEELPQREHLPIHLVVAEAVERIRPAAAQADIPIVVDEPNRRLAVIGDRRQLVSAVYNLLDNAVKYSDAGDPVRVRATTDGMRVEIAVEDRGVGIPAKDLDRVFERFYRVDPGRSRQTGGTGLGLAIVRHVASNHAGEVRVESRLGEGSTFTLSLPTASGPVLLTDAERAS
jgi:two-component system sensor histidine kinase SenX3